MSSSPAGTKQMEPEVKKPSQVRLEWKEHPDLEKTLVVELLSCRLMVEQTGSESVPWVGLISSTDYLAQAFATPEEAQLWCEAQLTELLEKDLKSLGGGVQAEPAEVKPAPESDIDPVISLSLEGGGSTLKLGVDGETQRGVYREWLWLMFWLPNEDEDGEELWVQLTFEEVKQLRDHLNRFLPPAEVKP